MMNEQKILTPELEARVHQAVDNFMQGYGCCQSVVAAFADLYGLDDEMAKRIGAGFGENGRILQVSPLRSQSRECCKNLRRISDGEKIRIYSYEIPE